MNQKQKASASRAKQIRQANVLESLKDLGGGTAKSIKDDLLKESARDLMSQIFGMQKPKKHFEGELTPGQSFEPKKVMTGETQKAEKLQKQLSFERRINQEERALLERKSNDIKLEIQAITTEIAKIAHSTPQLAKEIEVAAVQAPANPGIYHIIFFEKILQFLHSFRKKIENANQWLTASNKRAQKKGYWGMYKKHGGKFLLSSEHYSQRSAG